MRIDPLTPIAFNETQNTRTALSIQSQLPMENGDRGGKRKRLPELDSGSRDRRTPDLQPQIPELRISLSSAVIQSVRCVRKPRALPKDEDDLQKTANTKITSEEIAKRSAYRSRHTRWATEAPVTENPSVNQRSRVLNISFLPSFLPSFLLFQSSP